jgi:hypothetical protein
MKKFTGGIVLSIVLAKTIQFSERVHEIALAARPGSVFCPVAALRKLVLLRHGTKTGDGDLIFQIPVNGSWRPLCKDHVVTILRAQLVKMYLCPTDYSFHSFRHGGLQAAVRAQPNLELVKLQSGHMSDAVHVYTQMPGASRMVTGAKMLELMEREREAQPAGAPLS